MRFSIKSDLLKIGASWCKMQAKPSIGFRDFSWCISPGTHGHELAREPSRGDGAEPVEPSGIGRYQKPTDVGTAEVASNRTDEKTECRYPLLRKDKTTGDVKKWTPKDSRIRLQMMNDSYFDRERAAAERFELLTRVHEENSNSKMVIPSPLPGGLSQSNNELSRHGKSAQSAARHLKGRKPTNGGVCGDSFKKKAGISSRKPR